MQELTEQVTHHMDDTDACQLITWHRKYVEAHFTLVKRALLEQDSLLLFNCILEHLGPPQYIAMTGSQLISSTQVDQVDDLLLVP